MKVDGMVNRGEVGGQIKGMHDKEKYCCGSIYEDVRTAVTIETSVLQETI